MAAAAGLDSGGVSVVPGLGEDLHDVQPDAGELRMEPTQVLPSWDAATVRPELLRTPANSTRRLPAPIFRTSALACAQKGVEEKGGGGWAR